MLTSKGAAATHEGGGGGGGGRPTDAATGAVGVCGVGEEGVTIWTTALAVPSLPRAAAPTNVL